MEPLITLATSFPWQISIPIIGFLILAFATPYGKIHLDEATRKHWTGALGQSHSKSRYIRFMRKRLDWLDARLSTHEFKSNQLFLLLQLPFFKSVYPQKTANKPSVAKTAWSVGLINTTLLLAIAYPIVAFLFQWIAGGELRIGGKTVIPTGDNPARIVTFVWLGIPACLYLLGSFSKAQLRVPMFAIAIAIVLIGRVLVDRSDLPIEIALASSIALGLAFAITFVTATKVTIGATLAAPLVFIGISGAAVGITFQSFTAGTIVGVLGFGWAISIEYLDTRYRTSLVQIVFLIWMISLVTRVTIFFWQPFEHGNITYLIVFLAILPAFNALADFASIGLTRYLLRKGLDGLTWWQALIDAIGGLLIFFILGCTLITYFHLVQTPDGPLLNIAGLFNDLQNHPADMWWLAIMLGSTLIPTLLHAAIGIATFGLQAPKPLRKWIIEKLESGGKGITTDGWHASLAICAMTTLSLWLPVLGFYYAFTANHNWLFQATITIFKSYAILIGAVP